MIWGETWEHRNERCREWHSWFAWRPVGLIDGRLAWLEVVERCEIIPWGLMPPRLYWSYRQRQGGS